MKGNVEARVDELIERCRALDEDYFVRRCLEIVEDLN